MNWRQIFRREIHQLLVLDKRRAVFLFGASLAYMVLFSLLYCTHTINAVPLAICDEDQTAFSRSLIQAFADSEKFHLVRQVATQEEMEDALEQKAAYAAVQIPKKFTQEAKADRSATVLLMVDGANILIANTVSTAAQEVVAAASRDAGAKLSESRLEQLPALAAGKVGPVELRLRILNNPTQSYLAFFVLGLAMAAIQQGIFLAVGASIQGEYRQPRDLPANWTWKLMSAKLLPYVLSAMIAFFLTLEVGAVFFQVPAKASPLGLGLLGAAFIVCAVALSAFLAAVCDSELTFNRISIAYSVPAFVMSGYTWPQESMGALGKILSYAFPLSYFSNTIRELMLAGYSPALQRHCEILLAIGVAAFVLANRCFGKKLRHG